MGYCMCAKCWNVGHVYKTCKISAADALDIQKTILAEMQILYDESRNEAQRELDVKLAHGSAGRSDSADRPVTKINFFNSFRQKVMDKYQWSVYASEKIIYGHFVPIINDKPAFKVYPSRDTSEQDAQDPKVKAKNDLVEQLHPGLLDNLKVRSNSDVAKQFGLSRERVRQIRINANLPKHKKSPKPIDPQKQLEQNARRVISQNLQDHHHLFGVMSDHKIADLLGINVNRAFEYRKKMKIPPFRTSPRSHNHESVNRKEVWDLAQQGVTTKDIAQQLKTNIGYVELLISKMQKITKNNQFTLVPQIAELRQQGLSFAKIGKSVGISADDAVTLFFFA